MRSRCVDPSWTCSPPRRTHRCASTSGATRSTGWPSSPWPTSAPPWSVERVSLFPARELLPTPEVRERAERLVATDPWGREQWQRLADGEVFEGMEAWLPWLVGPHAGPPGTPGGGVGGEHVLFDLLPADAQVLLVEPRRLRDRAMDVLAEEVDLGATLSRTWGLTDDHDLPRLHVDFERLLAHTDAPSWSVASVADTPDSPAVSALGWPPAVGGGEALLAQLRQVVADGYRVVVCADGAGSAARLDKLLAEHGLSFPVLVAPDGSPPDPARLLAPGGAIVVAALDRGCILPAAKLALLAEADLTGRRRTHRPARAPRRDAQRFFEDLKVGRPRRAPPPRRRPLRRHGHPGHGRGGAGLPAARVPRRRQALRPVGPDRHHPALLRRRDPVAQPDGRRRLRPDQGQGALRGGRDRPGAGRAVPDPAERRRATPSRPDTPWQREMEAAFPFEETPDQLAAIADVKADMESSVPMDRLVCGDVGLRQDRGGACAPPSRRCRTASRWRCWCPPRCWPSSTTRPSRERFAGYPVRVEVLSRFLHQRPQAQERRRAARRRRGGRRHRHPPAALRATSRSRTWACWSSTRSSASAWSTRRPSSSSGATWTCSPSPPRPSRAPCTWRSPASATCRCSTPRPQGRLPILTYVGEYDERAVAEAIRRELLREGQVFYVHNRVRGHRPAARPASGELVPEARVAVGPRPDGRGQLEQVMLDFWRGPATTCWSAPPSSSPAWTCPTSTPSSSTTPTGSAWPSSTSCGAGWAAPASGPTPTCSSRPTGS